MKQTDLHIFYQLGAQLQDIKQLGVGATAHDALLNLFKPEEWLEAFLKETFTKDNTLSLLDSRQAAEVLLAFVRAITKPIYANPNAERPMTPDDIAGLRWRLEKFESEFARECRGIDVFTVTDKGTHVPRKLMAHAELNLPADVRARLDKKSLVDLKSAGRCLVFDTPTASAFHVLRSVEPMIVKYMDLVTARVTKKVKSRNWGTYIRLLSDHGGDPKVVSALQHIKDFYRNPIMHPEETLTADEALSLFHTCLSVLVQLDAAIQGWKGKP